MIDRNSHARRASGTPGAGAFVIAPNDTADLPFVTRAIYVGTGGDIRAQMLDGEPVTFVAVPQGTVLPVQITRLFATGTTASDLIGLD